MDYSVTNTDFNINQGDDFESTLSISGVDAADGCIFKLGARYKLADDRLALSKVAEVIDSNTIQFLITHNDTAALRATNIDTKFNRLYYDVQMVRKGRAQRILEGELFISPGNAYKVGDVRG